MMTPPMAMMPMAMRNAHFAGDRGTFHRSRDAASHGADRPATAPPTTMPAPAPLNLSPGVEQAPRLKAAAAASASVSLDINIVSPKISWIGWRRRGRREKHKVEASAEKGSEITYARVRRGGRAAMRTVRGCRRNAAFAYACFDAPPRLCVD